MKKLLAITLIALIISTLSFGALPVSAESFTDGYYTYTVSDDKATITDVDTSISGNITIPSTLGGYPVTSIGDSAFYDCTGLTNVTIGDSVTSISDYAFGDCISLTSVTIPNSVTSIGSYAFWSCTGLTSVTIGDSVTSIGESAFNSCEGLTKVNITDLKAWFSIDFGRGIANPLYYAKNLYLNGTQITNLAIPDGVTSIGKYAFDNCQSLTSVTIPSSVTSIGDGAFYECTGLTSVTISSGVTSIGYDAFCECTGLTSITIPDSVTSIGSSAFYNCTGLTDVYYTGTKEQWSKISIGTYNTYLTNATIHYVKSTKTTVSDDGKNFSVALTNIENGKTVILALYSGNELAEMQSKVYNGADLSFTTTKAYTDAKVMVWEDLTKSFAPVCTAEIIE